MLTQCYANVKELLRFSTESFWQIVKMRRDNRKDLVQLKALLKTLRDLIII